MHAKLQWKMKIDIDNGDYRYYVMAKHVIGISGDGQNVGFDGTPSPSERDREGKNQHLVGGAVSIARNENMVLFLLNRNIVVISIGYTKIHWSYKNKDHNNSYHEAENSL